MVKRIVQQPNRVLSGALAFVLWAATAALGLFEIVVVREMLLRICACLGSDYLEALNLGNWAVFVLAILWLALVVGGAEYHYRRFGQRSSWKLFGWTIAVEVLILVLALFI